MKYVDADEATVRAIHDEDAKALGYPQPGVHVGGGVHVDLGTVPGPGWTTQYAPPEKHPTQEGRYCYPAREGLEDAVTGKVPAAALTAVRNAKELDETWAKPKPDKPTLIEEKRHD